MRRNPSLVHFFFDTRNFSDEKFYFLVCVWAHSTVRTPQGKRVAHAQNTDANATVRAESEGDIDV
jgi:hypothetical protein